MNCAGEVKKVIGLVGKGLTFDSGGYNLKVGGMIEMMKFDMGGAGAVLGAAQAIAAIKPDNIQVLLPLVTPQISAHFRGCPCRILSNQATFWMTSRIQHNA